MAYAVVHFFPNGTKEQYENTIDVVHPDHGTLPPGQIYHAAGASEGGWTVVAVHKTKADWKQFRDGTLMPKLQAGIPGGFTSAPEEQAFEVHHLNIQS
jgi:hypothetical protein